MYAPSRRHGPPAMAIAALFLVLPACGQAPTDNLSAPDYNYQVPLHAHALQVIFSPSGFGTIERTGGWTAQVAQPQADEIAGEINRLPGYQANGCVRGQQPPDDGAWFALSFAYANGIDPSSMRIDATGCRSVWQIASYSPYKSAFKDANLFNMLQELHGLAS
jgi:hypothetical protein